MNEYKALMQAVMIFEEAWTAIYKEEGTTGPATMFVLHAGDYLRKQAKVALRGEDA